jgi:hypothetical protein
MTPDPSSQPTRYGRQNSNVRFSGGHLRTGECHSADLLDVESFELLQRRMAVLEGIARGEMAVAEERIVSHADATARMGRWLK